MTTNAGAGPFAAAISAQMRAELGKQRISANQLSKLVPISQPTLSKRLRDDGAFSMDEVEVICAALGLDVFEFVAAAHANYHPELATQEKFGLAASVRNNHQEEAEQQLP
ncbi:helix-turn-helix transcriptional regulator [Arthrobacter sp. UCD-GKA]|uniref:helix-turn-helix domain-containing protein n=1 Tax=Arthrobacter sp. UCD-GKA TaxID=1913576 RepID=UPI0011135946